MNNKIKKVNLQRLKEYIGKKCPCDIGEQTIENTCPCVELFEEGVCRCGTFFD